MNLQKIAIDKLKLAKYNPRKDLKPGDPEYEKLKRSILEFGYVEPIVWNSRTGNVVGGHQRLKILKEQGLKEVNCVVVDMDEQREKALNVALNKVRGDWDLPLLKDLLQELDKAMFDVSLTGFDAAEVDELLSKVHDKEVKEDDFDAEKAIAEIKEPVSKYGDIWLLGRHRLMCGDATCLSDILTLMDGKKANMCITDPPYNVNYEGATQDKLKIINDKMASGKFYEFLLQAFKNIFEVLDDGCAVYVFHGDTEGLNFRRAFVDAGFHLSNVCVWVKNSMVMGRCDYHWQHEPILYGWKPTGSHKWYADRKQTTVWNYDRPSRNAEHPTMKPVGLVAYPIKNSSMSNCLVLDPFGGSGSTLIACEQTNRVCLTMELDPKYCDVIVKRYIENVGTDKGIFLLRDGEQKHISEVQKQPVQA